MHPYAEQLTTKLTPHKNQENADYMKAYMRGQFAYLGVKTPTRRDCIKDWLKEAMEENKQISHELILELWELPEREYQLSALDLLRKYARHQPAQNIDLYEALILKKSWWDTVDGLASWVVGTHFKIYPEQIVPYTSKWIENDNFWLQRTAIIFQLLYKENTDWELLKRNILRRKDSKEFFIQKAIGWSLRQYSRTAPESVRAFIQNNSLAPLSEREGMKLLNKH